ncbi:MAG: hypothetical protein K8R21_02260 [Leptospira sp.]|nr:hypothetical protein [Leptospira sp.]
MLQLIPKPGEVFEYSRIFIREKIPAYLNVTGDRGGHHAALKKVERHSQKRNVVTILPSSVNSCSVFLSFRLDSILSFVCFWKGFHSEKGKPDFQNTSHLRNRRSTSHANIGFLIHHKFFA